VFLTCRKYGISLNPKKSLFGLEEGKLLGHIISKYGIRIDPDMIQAILQVPHPRNIKELQAFLRKDQFPKKIHSQFGRADKTVKQHAQEIFQSKMYNRSQTSL